MTTRVLTKRDFAIDERCFHGRKLGCAQIFLAKQFVDRAGANPAKEHSLCVDPAAFDLLRAAADEDWPWRAESNEFMRVDGQIVLRERSRIFQKISRHPMVFGSGSDVF